MQALDEYEGAVILISHDRHLIEACADRLWVVRGGTVTSYDGDMDSYRAELLAERGAGTRGQNKSGAKADAARSARSDQRRAAADRRASLAPLKKAMQAAEKKVETIGADIARLDAKLGRSAALRQGSASGAERRHRARTIGEAFERGGRGLADCLRSVRSRATPTCRTPLRRKLSNSRDYLASSNICAICT